MKKIRIQVQGGLGNQLFIWAMAHDITRSTGNKVQLIYIADRYQRKDRPNELNEIKIHCSHQISVKESRLWGYIFKLVDKSKQFGKIVEQTLISLFRIYSCESEFEIPNLKEIQTRMVRGFFQNSEMVNRHRLILIQELGDTFRLIGIKSENLQSIHIRRGDTVEISGSWGVLSMKYYEKLIDESKPIVFCTDSEVLANKLAGQYPQAKFSTPKTDSAWQTLKILSQSSHFIGGNSSLSWWAAWLVTEEKEGEAILPKPWRPNNQEASKNLYLEKVYYREAEFEQVEK